jgi:antigen 43
MSGTPPDYISGVRSGGFTYTSGQAVDVISGGVAYNMIFDHGAYEYLDAFGSATNNIVYKGGEIDVEGKGAYASGTILSGGLQSVTIGAAYSTAVYAGGVEDVSDSGTDTGSIISSGGGERVYSGGIDYTATVHKGGTVFITQGGLANGTTVNSGGRIILAGDVLYDTNFTATSGSAKAVGVYKGGIETVTFTGVKNSPYEKIVNTATATGYDRSYYKDGVLTFTEDRIGNEAGGSAVLGGGSIGNLTIASGGEEIIGGKTTVHSGGGTYKFKFNNITVSNSLIGKGAKQIVESGNTALGTTIAAGGQEIVKSGATATGTIIDGGKLILDASAKLSESVMFEGTGGELVVSGTTMPTTTISGFGAGDEIQLFDVVYSAGATAKVKTAGVVTVTNGGVSYNLNIAGATVGQKFSFDSNSVLTTTAPAQAAVNGPAKMSFLTPASTTSANEALPGATISTTAAARPNGWVHEPVTPGAAYALLTSAQPSAIIAPITFSGGAAFR